MADISQGVSTAERSLRRLRSEGLALSFTVAHNGDDPLLVITVPFPTDASAPGFNGWRFETVHKQIRNVLPKSIPFQIVGSRLTRDGG